MVSNSDLQCLRSYIAAHRVGEDTMLEGLWAGRCAALLVERQRLVEQVEALTREVDAVLERKREGASQSNTWVI